MFDLRLSAPFDVAQPSRLNIASAARAALGGWPSAVAIQTTRIGEGSRLHPQASADCQRALAASNDQSSRRKKEVMSDMKSSIWPGLEPTDTPLPSHGWKNCPTAELVMGLPVSLSRNAPWSSR